MYDLEEYRKRKGETLEETKKRQGQKTETGLKAQEHVQEKQTLTHPLFHHV